LEFNMKVEDLLGRPHLEDHRTAIAAASLVSKLTATYEDRLQMELAVLKGGSEKELEEHCNLSSVLDDVMDDLFSDRWEVKGSQSEANKLLERIQIRAVNAARSFAYALYSPE
jgi:hypothetical protein